ncbi:MAG: ATP-binding cassette domain-containing protein, partial [Candidatus Aminicenantes bacterium]|nr:ATP-binding cassette domain-containing protein [Candidatus Aminicenantes bacterium]
MIAEPVLNGLLHLFALIASRLQGPDREAARRRTLDYLNNHVGLSDAGVYLGLFEDLVELHENDGEAALLRSAGEISGALQSLLQGAEKYAAVVHVLDLAAVSTERGLPRRIAGALGRKLGLEETAFERIAAFSADPCKAAQSAPDVRILPIGEGGGRIAALRLEGEHLFLVASVGDEPLRLESRPLEKGSCQTLHPGQVIRDRRGNELYFSGIAALFRDGKDEGPVLDFRGENLEYRFPRSENGIRDFSFAERDGRLVGIMGGSGSGKSTLLGLLNGMIRPDSGRVLLNGRDIHADREAGEGVIGYIPQDDLLFEDLTVFDNLYFAARLCLAHLADGEIRRRVRSLLDELGQAETSGLKVGSPLQKTISGGQRKRLNIALELVREPTVLFVDEPTSGLSSADSETVMSLLREQAARGKLVFVVIHQPSSKIFRMFDALWILDQGGWPIFSGSPLEAVSYFRRHGNLPETWESICPGCGGVNPEQIFEIVEARTVDGTGRLTRKRRIPSEKWHERFREHSAGRGNAAAAPGPSGLPPPARSLNRPGLLGQLDVFFRRDVRARLANRSYLLVTFLEPLVLGLLTGLISRGAFGGTYSFHDNNNLHAFFFMSVIVAVFLGLSVSAEEICRDGRILKRERFLRLSWGSYINSKALYLALVSAVQMLLFAVTANAVVELPGMLLPCWVALFLCAFCSNILGLNISAS